jgi:hypothetical protein
MWSRLAWAALGVGAFVGSVVFPPAAVYLVPVGVGCISVALPATRMGLVSKPPTQP